MSKLPKVAVLALLLPAVAIASGISCTCSNHDVGGDVPSVFPQIAFVSDRDACGHEAYVMNADGSNLIRLTDNQEQEQQVQWSEDGSKILFSINPYTYYDPSNLYNEARSEWWEINADGSGRSSPIESPDDNPVNPDYDVLGHSPDGTKILFREINTQESVPSTEGPYYGPFYNLYIKNTDGSNKTLLLENAFNIDVEDWSPDGSVVIVEVFRQTGYNSVRSLEVVNTDGSGTTELITEYDNVDDCTWSPDSSRASITMRNYSDRYDLYVFNADGSGLTQVIEIANQINTPIWSPDGTRLLVSARMLISMTSDSSYELLLIDTEDFSSTTLIENAETVSVLGWTPDGTKALISRQQMGEHDYVYNLYLWDMDDHSTATLITDVERIYTVAWSPDRSRALIKVRYEVGSDRFYALFLINADGSGLQVIITDTTEIRHIEWMQGGSRALFMAGEHTGSEYVEHLYSVNADGTGLVKIIADADSIDSPTWAPDGSRAFIEVEERISEGNDHYSIYHLYIINAYGTGLVKIIADADSIRSPMWAPDGSRAFVVVSNDIYCSLYAIKANGSDSIEIIADAYEIDTLRWSPHDSKAYITVRRPTVEGLMYGLYSVDSNGSDTKLLAQNSNSISILDWGLDGTKIVYVESEDGTPYPTIHPWNSDISSSSTIPSYLSSSSAYPPSYPYSPPDYIGDLYIANTDGSGKKLLMANCVISSSPVWSPNGDKVLLAVCDSTADPYSPHDIFVVDADGANPTNLTNSPAYYRNISWSPSGSKIAFISNRDCGGKELYMMHPDGTKVTRLSHTSQNIIDYVCIPSEGKIAYTAGLGPNLDVYLVDLLLYDTTKLDVENISSLLWSPNGLKIAYIESETGWLYVMDFDGENRERITSSYTGGLVWSPDGSDIFFEVDDYLYNADADGSDMKQITANSTGELVWSPDGSKMLYASYDSLYVADADGTNRQRVARNTGDNLSYSWSPDGSKIAYGCDNGLFTTDGDDSDGLFSTDNEQRLVTDPVVEAVWSPNGAKIYYSIAGKLARWGWYEAYTIDANGENNLLVDPNYYHEEAGSLRWFSDERVIFNQNGAWYTVSYDGVDWERLDEEVYTRIDTAPSYQQQFIYELRIEANVDIYICDAEGGNAVRLTKHEAADENPKWVTLDMDAQSVEQRTR